MLAAHGDALKMQGLSYVIEWTQSHFAYILYLYLHFIYDLKIYL